MIAAVIRWSLANRFFVLLGALALLAGGLVALRSTPVDALPDLSDVQVVIRTSAPGQAPRLVEDQITYPLATTMLSTPGAKTVRGYSFFGDSFVYVLFADGTDPYWARSRVLESLNQVQGRLPAGARPALGPDATGVGWIFEYALVDRGGRHDLGQLRSIQDWFVRYELKTLPGVAEVASLGGMVRQYQVVLDPWKLTAYGVTHQAVVTALNGANQEAGGSVVEMAEAEYMVRATGYLRTLDDFAAVPIKTTLPPGVEIVTTYDRSGLIDRAIDNLRSKLFEEFIVVALVCALFLWRLRSALVAIVALPLGVLAAFIVMRAQGVNANIMSLGGIAIAVGAMVDAAVVMIENAHKHLERWAHDHPGQKIGDRERWEEISAAAVEVGPALFLSLLIITFSFIPVFTLQGQEGRLFAPLAFTKTYAMAAAALLSITLIPVLMGYLIRGRIPAENANPINRALSAVYAPALNWVLERPRATLVIAVLVFATTLVPVSRLGGEFMPALDEGDLLYMPSALPGLSAAQASALLQRTDRLIKTVPEVDSVFGKAGRAESATDPAPLEMFETTIRFKPRDQWRPGMTPERLVEELDRVVAVPGLTNVWVPPIRNRIDMLATGVKSPIGVKVSGANLGQLDRVAQEIARVAKTVPGVSSALAERLTGGRYLDVSIDRVAAGRYGLNIDDVQALVSGAIGGQTIGETVEGLARYPISVRYPRELRGDLDALRALPILTPSLQQITLGAVAQVTISEGPPMLKSENGRPITLVYVDVRGRDLSSVVADLRRAVAQDVKPVAGVDISYSGQFEYLQRAVDRLKIVVPATLLIIFVLLYLTFRRFDEAALIMGALPFALTGGFWALYLLGFNQSVATGVGFIALAGVSAEFGVVMLIYLKQALAERRGRLDDAGLVAAIREGALLRVRPKAMTVAVILAGLFPILVGHGAGSEVMSRIAAPMIGGMLSAPLLSMFVVPAAYLLIERRRRRPITESG